MGKITQAMQGWLKYYNKTPGNDALSYIESGDPTAIAAIEALAARPKHSTQWMYWTHQLAGILPAPAKLDDEGRRALRALAAVRAFDSIGHWISYLVDREVTRWTWN